MQGNMLSFDKITCERGGNVVFRHLAANIEAGSILALKGANGSGKTTLLKALAGIIPISEGKILWNGQNIKENYEEFQADIEFIGHKDAIDDYLTVEENLEFWAEIEGNPELVLPAALFFGLENFAETPAHMLSAGWRRKLALSRLLLSGAMVWLLDEPFTNLDDDGAARVKNLIETRAETGGVVIFTSHGNTPLPNKAVELDINRHSAI